jgi:hypothetical protein
MFLLSILLMSALLLLWFFCCHRPTAAEVPSDTGVLPSVSETGIRAAAVSLLPLACLLLLASLLLLAQAVVNIPFLTDAGVHCCRWAFPAVPVVPGVGLMLMGS